MPIIGPSSYLPTVDQFIVHWTEANTVLGASGPIELGPDQHNVAYLSGLRTTLYNQREAIEVQRNQREMTRAGLENRKALLLERLNQFTAKLTTLAAADSVFLRTLPKAFGVSDGMARVLAPLQDMKNLWSRWNTQETAFTLRGDYPLATFTTDVAELDTEYKNLVKAEKDLELARAARNQTQDAIRPILTNYRLRIESDFDPASPIAVTLPRYSPLPGSTPDAATLNGVYNPTTEQADLAGTDPGDPRITHWQYRGCAGPDYDPEDESILHTIPAGQPLTFSTDFALTLPGTAASFKLFAMTATGNEKGSNVVTVVKT